MCTKYVEEPEGKSKLRRQRHRWKNNIKMDLGEIGLDSVNYINLAQDRVPMWQAFVNTAVKLWVQ
jgi:hypothetical protein